MHRLLSSCVTDAMSVCKFPSTAIISFLILPLIFPVSTSINNSHIMLWLQNNNFMIKKKKKKKSELEQVNGECSSERRLMRAAGRSHKSEKWIMIMQASHTWNTSPSWQEVQNANPWLSKGQSITCLTIYQNLLLAGRVKELATFWFPSSAGLHCNFYCVFTKEGIIKGITW